MKKGDADDDLKADAKHMSDDAKADPKLELPGTSGCAKLEPEPTCRKNKNTLACI